MKKTTAKEKKLTPAAISRKAFVESLKFDGIDFLYLAPQKNPKASQKSETKRTEAPIALPTASQGTGGSPRDILIRLRDEVKACTLCSELSSERTNTVFGAGNVKADLVFVGEAPGREEDLEGLPFVGRAGKLLTKMIEAIGMSRKDVFICNTLKCRPPGNRPPKPDEIKNCNGYLVKQLNVIQPKVICALGTFAAQTLLQTDTPISRLRGTVQSFEGIPVICSYHPAYLLRNPSAKKYSWEDLQKIQNMLK